MTPTRLPAPAPALDEPTLLRAVSGDPSAFGQLYAAYHPLVLAVARRTLGCLGLHEAAPDLAAEVWLRLLDQRCRVLRVFDPTRGSFHGFMRMVVWQHARVIALRWWRQRQHESPHALGDSLEPRAPCAATALHHRQLLHRMLAEVEPRLSTLDRTLLVELCVQQTQVSELAPRLGCSPSSLYKRHQRLRARFVDAARRLDRAAPRHAAPRHAA